MGEIKRRPLSIYWWTRDTSVGNRNQWIYSIQPVFSDSCLYISAFLIRCFRIFVYFQQNAIIKNWNFGHGKMVKSAKSRHVCIQRSIFNIQKKIQLFNWSKNKMSPELCKTFHLIFLGCLNQNWCDSFHSW